MKPRLDELKQREICAILAVGGTRQLAAHYAGCHVRTIYNTLKRDPAFADRVAKTEASSELNFLKTVLAAAGDSKNWRAAIWALERMYPERYGRRSPTSITTEQMQEIIQQIVAAVAEAVPVKTYRRTIRAKIEAIIHNATPPAKPQRKQQNAS